MRIRQLITLATLFSALPLCAGADVLTVTATAYNSVASQTDDTPDVAAWGDSLKPGMKTIAVSRDLLEMGLSYGSSVRIDGMEGEYVVLDKMAKRWRKRIDIYMGEDIEAARNFGRRSVQIRWGDDLEGEGGEPAAE